MSKTVAELKTKISVELYGVKHELPYTFYQNNIIFTWELPKGIKQKAYIFQMKTRFPIILNTNNDSDANKYAYYYSSRIISNSCQHQIKPDTAGNILNINTWKGACQVRLTVFDQEDNEYCTHQYTDEITYDFEIASINSKRYRRWDSTNDNYYFCFYQMSEILTTPDDNLNLIKYFIEIIKSQDPQIIQRLKYKLQISKTPLFAQGLNKDSLIEINNISINDQTSTIYFDFTKNNNVEEKQTIDINLVNINQPITTLKYNDTYYARLQSFDGYDYSEWSQLIAFHVIYNSLPKPQIIGVYYPTNTINFINHHKYSNGIYDGLVPVSDIINRNNFDDYQQTFEFIQTNRQQGQLIVKLKVVDNDNDYVYSNLSFSMYIDSQTEANSLNCDTNTSTSPVNYKINIEPNNSNPNSKGVLLRVRTDSNLMKIPTNKEIQIVWKTKKQMYNQIRNYVYLYFCVRDEYYINSNLIDNYKFVISSEPMFIYNIGIEQSGNTLSNLTWWNKGLFDKTSLYMPLLPDSMKRKNVSIANGFDLKSSSAAIITNSQKLWTEFWNKYENGGQTIYIPFEDGQMVKTEGEIPDMTIIEKTTSSKQVKGLDRVTQNSGNPISVVIHDKYCLESKRMDYSEALLNQKNKMIEVLNNIGQEENYQWDYEALRLQINYDSYFSKTSSTKNVGNGFVSFCPDCDTIQVLKTIIIRDGKQYANVYQLYPDGVDTYDDKPINYFLKCDNCGKIIPIENKFQSNLSFNMYGSTTYSNYAYYHGYNHLNNDQLIKELTLMYKKEFDQIESDYKKEHNNEDYYYTFVKPTLPDGINWNGNPNSEQKDESAEYSLVPLNKLLKLKKRPDIQPYFKLIPPSMEFHTYGIYNDGSKLNGTVQLDYLTAPNKDPLEFLANQPVWKNQNLMHYRYVEGKGQIDYQEGGAYTSAQRGTSFTLQQSKKDLNTKSPSFYSADLNDYKNQIVTLTDNVGENYKILWQKAEIVFDLIFPLTIQRGINDKFKIIINDKQIIQKSVLPDEINEINVDFPLAYNSSNNLTLNSNWNNFHANILSNLLKDFFDYNLNFNSSNNKTKTFFNVDVKNKSCRLIFYGSKNYSLKTIQYLPCLNSCYNTLGLQIFRSYQSYRVCNVERVDEEIQYPVKTKEQDIKESVSRSYAKSTQNISRPIYDYEESPIDNTLQTSFNILSVQAHGEPLFTCYPDEVDKRGYHFKFNEEDFKKTGKIYVRTYHIENCNPFPKPGYGPIINNEQTAGFRNWIVVPIDPVNKPGRYYKKQVLKFRGQVCEQKIINVKDVDGTIIQQNGYFNPINNQLLSHKKPEQNESNSTTNEEEIIYEKLENETWRNKIMPKTCVVFDYVPFENAITKNYLDFVSSQNFFNHKVPINIKGLTFEELQEQIKRYGVYALGSYDLTEDQKSLTNNTDSYKKKFSSTTIVYDQEAQSSYTSTVEYDVTLPNNWRPQLINTKIKADFTDDTNYNSTFQTMSKKLYKNKYVDEIKTIKANQRYKKAWENKVINSQVDGRELSQFTVEQFNPVFKIKYKTNEKWGYEPDKCLNSHFKINEKAVQEQKQLPVIGNEVHNIYKQPWIEWRLLGKLTREYYYISDKSQINDEEGFYNKQPYLDYPLFGKINFNRFYYFSGYPRSQDPINYANRPQPVYPYDRQLRIGGFNKTRYMKNTDNVPYNYNKNYKYLYGAYISKEQMLKSRSMFYYMQDSWNTFNRLHWDINLNKDQIIFIYAQEYNEQTGLVTGEVFSVKTKNSIWYENGTREGGAWGIPYSESMSELVDFSNQENFKDKHYYKFYLDEMIGNAISVDNTGSRIVNISQIAISPVNIISTSYEPWTKELTVQFRLDDALGRTYDIVKFQYSLKDYYINGVRQNDWKEGKLNLLQGQIYDLDSNKNGDNVPDSFIIKHKLIINLSKLGIRESESFRIQLYSALALQRNGLTLPCFQFKLWANEFLKPVQETIKSLQGFKSRWVWRQTSDPTTESGYWEYVSKENAVSVIGDIQFNQNSIDEIDNKFEEWFYQKALFSHPDLDSVETFLHYKDEWNEFYYITIFNKFIDTENDEDYKNYFDENKDKDYKTYIINRNYLIINLLEYEFEQFYQQNRMYELYKYKQDNNTEFNKFISNRLVDKYQEIRQNYAQSNLNSIKAYFNIEYDNSSSSSSQNLFSDEQIIEFISSNKKRCENFISYYADYIKGIDTRFEQRALIMFNKYNIDTPNLFVHNLNNPNTNIDGIGIYIPEYYIDLSDKYQYIINNDNDENYFVVNYGKIFSRTIFLQTDDENGRTYSTRYQQLLSTLYDLKNQLEINIKEKCLLETNHRSYLIKQGFFCNGFENNMPYKENNEVNTCFRWRVETKAYQGSIEEGTIIENGQTNVGYQPRFEPYIRFQLDFFGTFNSQNGLPLRDIIYVKQKSPKISSNGDLINGQYDIIEKRIKATTPIKSKNDQTIYLPENKGLQVEESKVKAQDYNSYDNETKQLVAELNIEKSMLPGRMGINESSSSENTVDILPEAWNGAWKNEANNGFAETDPYKSAYFYRIAAYNVVESPIFDSMIGRIEDYTITRNEEENYYYNSLIINNIFRDENIKNSQNYEINQGDSSIKIFYAFDKLESPVWRKNYLSYAFNKFYSLNNNNINKFQYYKYIYDDNKFYTRQEIGSNTYNYRGISFNDNLPQYNNDWININKALRGQVQFITDRPRYLDTTQKQPTQFLNQYLIKFNDEETYKKFLILEDTYTIVNNKLYPVYVYTNDNESSIYLYYAQYEDGIKYWFFNNDISELQKQDNSPNNNSSSFNINHSNFIISGFSGQATLLTIYKGLQNSSNEWTYRSTKSKEYHISIGENNWINKQGQKQSIIISDKTEEQIEIPYLDASIYYIDDNLNNFDTKWIPESPIRKKPFVVRLENEYLLFSHKIREYKIINNTTYQCNVITLSRGGSSDLFGQQCVCFPKYNYIQLDQIIPNAISFENPCVINLYNGIWRMYFNVVFYEQNNFINKIYKADTYDFEDWFDFKEVNTTQIQTVTKSSSSSSGSDIEQTIYQEDQPVNIYNNYEPFVKLYIQKETSSSSVEIESSSSETENTNYSYTYHLYVSHKNENSSVYSIDEYESKDGINFQFIHPLQIADNDLFYNLTSPFLFEETIPENNSSLNNENQVNKKIKKLYMTLITPDQLTQMIVSATWDYDLNDWKIFNQQSQLIIEKSNNSLLIGKPFEGVGVNYESNSSSSEQTLIYDHFSNPCVILDTDGGMLVQRLYYNTYDTPYLYDEIDDKKELVLALGKTEMTIHTEYLEEYLWKEQNINYINEWDEWQGKLKMKAYELLNDNWEQIINKTINDEVEEGWYEQRSYLEIPAGKKIKFEWKSNSDTEKQYYGFKIQLYSNSSIKESLSQSEWISFDNIMSTQAYMYPEQLKTRYNINEFTPEKFISEYELTEEYNQWINENSEYAGENSYLNFIIINKYYPKYNWWSKKGPGIYRYVGYNILQYYNWQGDEFN